MSSHLAQTPWLTGLRQCPSELTAAIMVFKNGSCQFCLKIFLKTLYIPIAWRIESDTLIMSHMRLHAPYMSHIYPFTPLTPRPRLHSKSLCSGLFAFPEPLLLHFSSWSIKKCPLITLPVLSTIGEQLMYPDTGKFTISMLTRSAIVSYAHLINSLINNNNDSKC